MKEDIKVIQDPEVVRVSLEDNRLKILKILKDEELTINEIAEKMNKHPSTIYRHIKKLEGCDMVVECGEKKTKFNPITVYTRSANVYVLDIPYLNRLKPTNLRLFREEKDIGDMVKLLQKVGVEDYDTDMANEIKDMVGQLNSDYDAFCEKLQENHREIDFFTALKLKLLIFMMKMHDDSDMDKNFQQMISNFNTD